MQTEYSMQIRPASTAHAAADAVRDMIVDGRLADGVRINEVHLARELGVSRTPLREALSALTAEGALTARPRLGFFVRPLTREEFEQLYDIRPLLDPEALRLSGIPSPKQLDRLERTNDALGALRGVAAIEKDDAWHLELVGNCPNQVLIDMIRNIILRTRRYELALMRESKEVTRAIEDHTVILDALRRNDLEAACAALKHNMQSGKAPILEWLATRAPTQVKRGRK
ncbi:MAG TPA: GntR family transcriptional regulator [Vitreimonas sp.]|nr:GntR family transcriptional regulator [Vitreimonas sp.]